MKKEEISHAIEIIEKQEDLSGKREVFLILASLNLLNAAIKQPEFKKTLSYGFIKTRATKLFEFLIQKEDDHPLCRIYYSQKEKCLYFKIYGMLLSFHDIMGAHGLIQTYARSAKNIPIVWDGLSKQAIAPEIFSIAQKNMATDFDISGEIVRLLNLARKTKERKERKRK